MVAAFLLLLLLLSLLLKLLFGFGCTFFFSSLDIYLGNSVSYHQTLNAFSNFAASQFSQVVVVGGSLSLFATADIVLLDVSDENSFSSIQGNLNFLNQTNRVTLTTYAGSLAMNSRFSVSLSNLNVKSCRAIAKYDGSGNISLAAIAGAVLLSASLNPFAPFQSSVFPKASRFSFDTVSLHGNQAACIHSVVSDTAVDSILTALGGGVTFLHTDTFANCSEGVCTRLQQNLDSLLSLTGAMFSNNSVSASFPTPPLSSPSTSVAKSVVLGGAL
jgi:hypothetical protein